MEAVVEGILSLILILFIQRITDFVQFRTPKWIYDWKKITQKREKIVPLAHERADWRLGAIFVLRTNKWKYKNSRRKISGNIAKSQDYVPFVGSGQVEK